MIENSNSNSKSVIIAAIVAGLLMFVSSAAHRVLAARLKAPVNTTPISPAALQRLPQQISDWTGREVPLDEAVVRATDTDAHVNRSYSRRGGLESVLLYIASGVKARDLMPHRPEVCYTGAGWALMDKRSMELSLNDDTVLPCNVMWFSRGALNTEKVMVLDYYIVDGQYSSNISLLRSKAWRGSGTVRYVAQVQIVTSILSNQTEDSAIKTVRAFAVESASLISRLFEDINEDQEAEDRM